MLLPRPCQPALESHGPLCAGWSPVVTPASLTQLSWPFSRSCRHPGPPSGSGGLRSAGWFTFVRVRHRSPHHATLPPGLAARIIPMGQREAECHLVQPRLNQAVHVRSAPAVPAGSLVDYLEIAAASALKWYSMMSPACRRRDRPFGAMLPRAAARQDKAIGSEQRRTGRVLAVSAP